MRCRPLGLWILLASAACSTAPSLRFLQAGSRVVVTDGPDMVAEFRADGPRGPALWPLLAPGGEPVTRAFPFAELDGEPRDHPHHTSLWFAHGAVNGVDFWQGDGRIVAVGPPLVERAEARLVQHCEWRDARGAVVARERRSLQFGSAPDTRTVDFATSVVRDDGPLVFGDTKEGTFALRLRQELCLEGPGAAGAVFDSEGRTAGAVWGQHARWIAYRAELAGAVHTVALFDHPDNHGHPTTWHARDYGLAAANPFGLQAFQGAPQGAGDLVVPQGAELRLRYRVWLHRGPCDGPAVEAAWRRYAAGK